MATTTHLFAIALFVARHFSKDASFRTLATFLRSVIERSYLLQLRSSSVTCSVTCSLEQSARKSVPVLLCVSSAVQPDVSLLIRMHV